MTAPISPLTYAQHTITALDRNDAKEAWRWVMCVALLLERK